MIASALIVVMATVLMVLRATRATARGLGTMGPIVMKTSTSVERTTPAGRMPRARTIPGGTSARALAITKAKTAIKKSTIANQTLVKMVSLRKDL